MARYSDGVMLLLTRTTNAVSLDHRETERPERFCSCACTRAKSEQGNAPRRGPRDKILTETTPRENTIPFSAAAQCPLDDFARVAKAATIFLMGTEQRSPGTEYVIRTVCSRCNRQMIVSMIAAKCYRGRGYATILGESRVSYRMVTLYS